MRARSAIGSVARAARYTNELVVHMRNGLPVLSVPVLPLSRRDASLSVQRLAGFHSRYTTRLDVAPAPESDDIARSHVEVAQRRRLRKLDGTRRQIHNPHLFTRDHIDKRQFRDECTPVRVRPDESASSPPIVRLTNIRCDPSLGRG